MHSARGVDGLRHRTLLHKSETQLHKSCTAKPALTVVLLHPAVAEADAAGVGAPAQKEARGRGVADAAGGRVPRRGRQDGKTQSRLCDVPVLTVQGGGPQGPSTAWRMCGRGWTAQQHGSKTREAIPYHALHVAQGGEATQLASAGIEGAHLRTPGWERSWAGTR